MQYSQIEIKKIDNTLLRVIIRQNDFVAGEVDLAERIFYSVPRSSKNLFYLFHGNEGGLGLNNEILHLDSFDTIKLKFNDKILTTTRRKWLAKGIISKYCNAKIDKQVIMKLSDINLGDAEMYEPTETKQQELFQES